MRARPLLFLLVFAAAPALAEQPRAAVVMVETRGLQPKEVELIIEAATAAMAESSGFRVDAQASASAKTEAAINLCTLEYECLDKVSQAVKVDAVVGLRAGPEGPKKVAFELIWVAADARGLPSQGSVSLSRNEKAIREGVRAAVRQVLPAYARQGIGGLTVLAEAGSEVQVDGQRVGKTPMAEVLILSAGIHQVDVISPSGQRVSKSVEVLEARKVSAELDVPNEAIAALIAPPEPVDTKKGLRTAAYVVGGVGAASLAGGMYFGLQANALNGRVRGGRCSDTPCPEGMTQVQAQKLYEQAQGQALLGNTGIGLGLLMGAGAGVMYWLGRDDEKK